LLTIKARGFLELSAAPGSAAAAFVNVLSTDPAVINELNAEIKSGRVFLSLGGRRYRVNTGAGDQIGTPGAEGGVVTDALVYAQTPNGYIALRATTLAVGGQALFTADKPVSLAVREGTVLTLDYSAHEGTQLAFGLADRPTRVSLDGQDHGGWSYAAQTGLVIELPAGNGVIGIR
jgi:hypothetical protein